MWHLVVPYTLTNNDSKFAPGRAFSTADDFFTFMRDALQALVDEAAVTGRPKVGLRKTVGRELAITLP